MAKSKKTPPPLNLFESHEDQVVKELTWGGQLDGCRDRAGGPARSGPVDGLAPMTSTSTTPSGADQASQDISVGELGEDHRGTFPGG